MLQPFITNQGSATAAVNHKTTLHIKEETETKSQGRAPVLRNRLTAFLRGAEKLLSQIRIPKINLPSHYKTQQALEQAAEGRRQVLLLFCCFVFSSPVL